MLLFPSPIVCLACQFFLLVPAKVIPARSKVVKQRKGASAVIRCEASGTPDIKLHWYKSSKPISVSSKFNENKLMRRVGNQVYVNSTLKINTLQRADNGTYICQVTNSFGGDTEDFRVVVLGAFHICIY